MTSLHHGFNIIWFMAHSFYFWDSIPANQCLVDWIITGLIVHVCASRIISCIQTLQLQIQLMCRLNMMLCLFYLCCNIITSYQSAATSVIIKHHGHGPSLVYAVLFRPLPSQLRKDRPKRLVHSALNNVLKTILSEAIWSLGMAIR